MKVPNQQSIAVSRILNHFTFQANHRVNEYDLGSAAILAGAGTVSLQDPKKIYVILEVRAAGAWSVAYRNSDSKAGPYTRNGSGNAVFPQEFICERAQFTGVTEVSGYWIGAIST